MGFFSGISNFVSSACNFIGGCLPSLGKALAGAASVLIGKLFPVIDIVISIVKVIGVALGLIEEKDEVDELGAKACESELKPEDFSTTEEYINHLKNDIKLDKEKFEGRSEIEKLAHKGIGVSIVKKGMEEKLGMEISNDFLYYAGKANLSGGETFGLMKIFKENNFTSMEKFESFMKNGMPLSEKIKTGEMITDGLLNTDENKDKSREDIEKKVVDMELKSAR
ncbi:MAG: hypothetical protein ACRCTS_07035 [Fusobacteriaceae bacterium]